MAINHVKALKRRRTQILKVKKECKGSIASSNSFTVKTLTFTKLLNSIDLKEYKKVFVKIDIDFLEKQIIIKGKYFIGICVGMQILAEKGFEQIDNLFAKIGNKGKNLAFAGHTDVVPPGNLTSWKYPPFSATISEGKLYGRGSEDMKGSIACFISATKTFLEKHGKSFNDQISFIITGDEEKEAVNGTIKIMEWTKKNNIFFNHCIVGEPTSNKIVGDKIKIGRRGSINDWVAVLGYW